MTQEEKLHREEASKRLSPEGKKFFELIEFDPEEQLVAEIRKHPFGLFIIRLIGVLVAITLLVIAIAVARADLTTFSGDTDTGSVKAIVILICVLLIAGTAVGTIISSILYKSNVIYVTNEKLAQVLYVSLFHRKISQLSIGDVQDVTVRQHGIFAHLYKYGSIVIETAGEQQNYTFTFVPKPYEASRYIISAHEANLKLHGN